MALGTPTTIGTRVVGATGTTYTLTTTVAVPSGATAIITAGASLGTNAPTAISDNGPGLTWILEATAQGPTSANISIFYAYCPAGMALGTVLTITVQSGTNTTKIAHGQYITGRAKADKSAVATRSTATDGVWATAATSGTINTGVAIGGCYFGALATNSNQTGSTPAFTELTDTSGSSRGMVTTYATGVTSGSNVIAAGTASASVAWAAAVVVFEEVLSPPFQGRSARNMLLRR